MVLNLKMQVLQTIVMNMVLIITSQPREHPNRMGWLNEKNRTLEDMTRTMLIASGLPRNFWAEALNTSCYIINRCMIRPILNKTP